MKTSDKIKKFVEAFNELSFTQDGEEVDVTVILPMDDSLGDVMFMLAQKVGMEVEI